MERELLTYCFERIALKYQQKPLVSAIKKWAWVLKNLVNGFLATLLTRPLTDLPPNVAVDVLFLHPSLKAKKMGRSTLLIEQLKKQGLIVVEEVAPSATVIFKKRLLASPSLRGAILFRLYRRYAYYLIEKYKPKVLITLRNGSLFSPFFKKFMQPYGHVVHLAHSIASKESSKFSMLEYDYYFLYGQSSLKYLQQLAVKYGECQAVLAGSYLFSSDFALPSPQKNKQILLLGMGPGYEQQSAYLEKYGVVKEWIVSHPEYSLAFKPHMRSENTFWEDLAREYDNIEVYNSSESLLDCLDKACVVFAVYTNAVIDAAIVGRPSILISDFEVEDHLEVEQFFLPRANSASGLDSRVQSIMADYDGFVEKAYGFATYHLRYQQDSQEVIGQSIMSLCKGQSLQAVLLR